jgi:hypothetical protein
MTRNLKALGLALVAVFAFAAISASAASAETKIHGALQTTPDGTANLVGTEVGGDHVFNVGGGIGSISCTNSEFHGHIAGKTTSPTITPTYTNCTFTLLGIPRPATVTLNGCQYTLTTHAFVDDNNGSGQIHVICPEGKKIEIHVFNNAAHTELRCTYAVEPQTIDTGNSFENMQNTGPGGTDTVTTIAKNAPAKTKKLSGTILQCGGSEFDSSYTGTVETHATNAEGKPVDLEVVTDT